MDDGTVYAPPSPGRHIDALKLTMISHKHRATFVTPDMQGFLTSTGRFVSRRQAAAIAIAAGQITETKFQPGMLFSEDLW